jgi:sugar/nucleoside kinase (ribokinase family)
MIVVVGLPAYADSPDGERCAGGLAVEVASAAQRRGSSVELVGKVGNDGAGDAVVVALGRLGIGHTALLRDPALPTPVLATATHDDDDAAEVDADGPEARLLPEDAAARPALDAADIDLALKFLPGASVIALAEPLPEAAVTVAAEAAAFSGARLIVLVPSATTPPAVPAGATVLEAPPDDDGSFGRLVGIFAGALDSGVEPAAAFAEAVAASGWEPVAD